MARRAASRARHRGAIRAAIEAESVRRSSRAFSTAAPSLVSQLTRAVRAGDPDQPHPRREIEQPPAGGEPSSADLPREHRLGQWPAISARDRAGGERQQRQRVFILEEHHGRALAQRQQQWLGAEVLAALRPQLRFSAASIHRHDHRLRARIERDRDPHRDIATAEQHQEENAEAPSHDRAAYTAAGREGHRTLCHADGAR